MENNQIKIIFMGTPEFGAVVLEELINSGYKPVLVITKIASPVKIVAEKYKIKVGHAMSNLQDIKPDLIIVAAYGQILPKEILAIPKYGCLNVHPSLLPKYRGPSPIQSAILNGDKKTGVTIMKMDEKIDSGPILVQQTLNGCVKPGFTQLHDELAKLGAKLLTDTIPKWVAGEIKAKPQDETKATYTKIIKKEDGRIDWRNTPEYIERQVRALNPWPGTYTLYKRRILKILKTEIINNKLIIKIVQLAGKKPMSFEDFFRGHNDYVNS